MAKFTAEGGADNFELYDEYGNLAYYYNFRDGGAYPFLIYKGILYIGDEGEKHSDIMCKMHGYDSYNDYVQKYEASHPDEDGDSAYHEFIRYPMEDADPTMMDARIWTKPRSSAADFAIVYFWGAKGHEGIKSYKKYVDELLNYFSIDRNKVMIATSDVDDYSEWDASLMPYNEWTGNVSQMSDEMEKKKKKHLLPPEEKYAATQDFRDTKEKLLAAKLGSMPLAKYNSIIHMDENKKKRIIVTESQLDELVGFHGSMTDFDKFNHKKYLNTGCGSQSFGWGTYVTDDRAIGQSYADTFLKYALSDAHTKGMRSDSHKLLFRGEDVMNNTELFRLILEIGKSMDKTPFNALISYQNLQDFAKFSYDTEDFYKNIEKCGFPILKSLVASTKGDWNLDAPQIEDAHSILYEVDIPDNNGTNYIEWEEKVPIETIQRILKGISLLSNKYITMIHDNDAYGILGNNDKLYNIFLQKNKDNTERAIKTYTEIPYYIQTYYSKFRPDLGKNLYWSLQDVLGSAKAASLLLNFCGFDGIRYPTGTRWKNPAGAKEGGHNYVIFQASKVKITNKELVK